MTIIDKDGKINAIEVQSKTDKEKILTQRNEEAMGKLPEENRGTIDIIKPNSIKK